MTTNTNALLPCPFCGSTNVQLKFAMGEYWTLCECHAGADMCSDKQKAITAWNTRYSRPVTSQDDVMEKLRTEIIGIQNRCKSSSGAIDRDRGDRMMALFNIIAQPTTTRTKFEKDEFDSCDTNAYGQSRPVDLRTTTRNQQDCIFTKEDEVE